MTVAMQALVPLFDASAARTATAALARFASRVLTSTSLAGLLLWALATLFARPLVSVTAPGIDPAQVALAASMVPPMFLVVPLVAAAETVRSRRSTPRTRSSLPAAMNLFMNGLTAAVVHPRTAATTSASSPTRTSPERRSSWSSSRSWRGRTGCGSGCRSSRGPAAARRAAAVRPTDAVPAAQPGNRVVEQLVASFLPAGSITVLSYGQRLISALGGGIFFRPVTVALLPRLADAEHSGGPEGAAKVAHLVDRGLRFVLAIALPLTAFTVALADPVVRIVFHRGSFGPVATQMLALTLAVYGFSLVGSGVQRVLLAPFYARLDTRTPLRNAIVGVVVDLVLLIPCVALFGLRRVEGVVGIALAFSITQYVVVWHAWHRLTATVHVQARNLLGLVLRLGVACALAAAAMLAWLSRIDLTGADRGRLLLVTVSAGLVGTGVLLLAGLVLFGPKAHRRSLLGRTSESTMPGWAIRTYR